MTGPAISFDDGHDDILDLVAQASIEGRPNPSDGLPTIVIISRAAEDMSDMPDIPKFLKRDVTDARPSAG